MNHKRRLHDAIVGIVVTAGVVLGHYVSAHWLLLPAVIGITLIQSGISRGFAPYTSHSIVCFLPRVQPIRPAVAQSKK